MAPKKIFKKYLSHFILLFNKRGNTNKSKTEEAAGLVNAISAHTRPITLAKDADGLME
jgi:hypothetical protein